MISLPGSIVLFAILGGVVPTFFWLWFWLQEDTRKPEPKRLIFKTFVIGSVSIVLAFILERMFFPDPNIAEKLSDPNINPFSKEGMAVILLPIAAWATIEETVKYLAAYLGALRSKYFDEPIDAMVYLITAALGFAAVENTLFLLNTLMESGAGTTFLFTGNLRFLGATILHTVSSAAIGCAISFAFYQSKFRKFIAFISGLVAASALHTLFNYFIIANKGKDIFKVLIFLWLSAILIIFLFERVKRVINEKYIINSSPKI